MRVKKIHVFACIVFCIGMMYKFMHLYSTRKTVTRVLVTDKVNGDSGQSTAGTIERNNLIQNGRIERIKHVCTTSSVFTVSKYKKQHNPHYYYSPLYNFNFCAVPKCGSTFWKQAFEILDNTNANADEVFARARFSVHRRHSLPQTGTKSSHKAPVVLVSRDPYSRLFSAYIDKFHIPQYMYIKRMNRIFQYINETRRQGCPGSPSFQTFLEHVVREASTGQPLNRHWVPISSICRPCESRTRLLVKQETFSSDFEYVLNFFNVSKQKEAILLSKIYSQRLQSTIPGIVETVYYHVTGSKVLECFGYHGIAERIWSSFQIQGFLKDTVSFPKHIRVSDLTNAAYLSQMIMNATALHPMSRDDQKAQRKAALVDAYRNVKKETIKQLQQVYKTDFALFSYSKDPPSF